MEEKPSRYHKYYYTGKGDDGHEYLWDSTHPDLVPTSTFQIESQHYCSYCCNKAYPIQANIKEYADYTTTGYCCICDSAEKEKEFYQRIKELQIKHNNELRKLKQEYTSILKHDKQGRLDLKYKIDCKRLAWSEDSSDFE